jgi:hypothetical protein
MVSDYGPCLEKALKICTKCNQVFPPTLDFFYKNAGGRFGLTPRCKPCVNKDNADSHAKRLAANPQRIRALATARTIKSYRKDIHKSRAYQVQKQKEARQDPVRGLRIKARKRGGGAGLSPEQLEKLFQSQAYKCAVCETTKPQDVVGAGGWNVDHCHASGVVRFILCNHCNRGLGAFRDNPDFLRKAAKLLESFNDYQSG